MAVASCLHVTSKISKLQATIYKLQVPQPKTRHKTLMNREIQTLSEKSFLRLIQGNPHKDAAEDNSITTASTGIYRLLLSLHFTASAQPP